MTPFNKKPFWDVTRRDFVGGAISAGTLLALAPQQLRSQEKRRKRHRRTFFFNLSHLPYRNSQFHFMVAGTRYDLRPLEQGDRALAHARRTNRFLVGVPDYQVTHVVEEASVPNHEVLLSYMMQDANTSTGRWQMTGMYLTPPLSSYSYAFARARELAGAGAPLPLSSKRKKYGLPAAVTLDDLLEEQALLDPTDWATAMVNVHPELLSADPDSAAHIQTNYIQHRPATFLLSEQLSGAGPATPQVTPGVDNASGWATLVPYNDYKTGEPLVGNKGANKDLILYDPKWQTKTNTFVSSAFTPALQGVKSDTTLGADVTGNPKSVPKGSLWTRRDATSSTQQQPTQRRKRRAGSGEVSYALTNITPDQNGYSCSCSVTGSGGKNQVTLNFQNWYLRYLGLYIQFLKSDGSVVSVNELPAGLGLSTTDATANNELLLGSMTPEFTIYGIPIMNSTKTVEFTFPDGVASSARIFASGLGYGSPIAADTEVLGIIMTVLFNLGLPASLMFLGLGLELDAFVKLFITVAQLVAQEIAVVESNGDQHEILGVFWHSIVRGAVTPILKQFVLGFLNLLAYFEVIDAEIDAIPIAGAIAQAIGAAGTIAEIASTTAEVLLSPKTYEYDLVATYDLSLSLSPDPSNPNGFPSEAVRYTVIAIFDKAIPTTQTLTMPSVGTKVLPPVLFNDVPYGGEVVLSVVFYEADGTVIGHGTTGPIANVLPSSPAITITQLLPKINASTVYSHKQKTALDTNGNHLWVCTAAPAFPQVTTACAPAPGNICDYGDITYNRRQGNLAYAWQSYTTSACLNNAGGQFGQVANIPAVNTGSNAQAGYAFIPCALNGTTKVAYDPLGRASQNFYLDTSGGKNLLRQISVAPTSISSPGSGQAWGKFNLAVDDMLLHPSGAILTVCTTLSRIETLKLPSTFVTDDEASANLIANVHAGFGSRPGLLNQPTAATITADGTVLVLEQGNNRIHAMDASGNPVQHFRKQAEPYFLPLEVTSTNTQYLDIAVDFTGLIYVLSVSNGVYRLDIYPSDNSGSQPLSTTMGFNAAKVTVDYFRNVYALNYDFLTINGSLPPSQITEPTVSQWIPASPPPCDLRTPPKVHTRRPQ